jgi:cytoskeletal protein CcmA (bactofilin family)
MFRTGHRTDHTAWVEPAPEPAPATPAAAIEETPRAEPVLPVAPRTMVASDTAIGNGVNLDGTLRFSGTMRMSGGTFTGTITAGDKLIIGVGATLVAHATCVSIEVHGEARGTLTAQDSVELRAPARVTADVSAPSLAIDKGVHFEGTVQMRGPAKAPRVPRNDGSKAKAAEPSD